MPNISIKNHPLVRTLVGLRGNPRACVFTEPMWGLSMNLCLPYASVYMLAMGMTDTQVGIVASIYMFSQMLFALLSGMIVDKLGRRLSTAVFDFFAWSVPCLIWAGSQGFWFFAGAALLNGMMKVTTVSWDCLLVEDAPPDKVTQLYTWVIICGNMSALFAPIASIMVSRLTMVPAVRILYINAFVVMTAKIIILYKLSRETRVGVARREAAKGWTLRAVIGNYAQSVRNIRASRGTSFAILISVLVEIVGVIGYTFWQIIASRRVGVPDALLPIFPMTKSVLSIAFLFGVIGRIKQTKLRTPLFGGFACAIAGAVLLIVAPPNSALGYAVLFLSLAFEALGGATLNTLRESLVAIHVRPEDRSGVMALLQTLVMLVSVPFGYIGGVLSDISKPLPFVMSIGLLAIGLAVTAAVYRDA
ncbi:MAG: MFS transporter [Oscillospiraceae bacterium]|jgi:MFS family permease|nr:MFS transporter [Oscillospiraceae bacterium]